jgi:hypothetical protein
LNQGPPACEAGALPLSYTPGKRPGMLAERRGPAPSRRSGRDSNPRDELTPPTRFPVALLQPLGHHSRRIPVSHGGAVRLPVGLFSRSERFFAIAIACARRARSRSFPLAPSASRSRLKLCRGTEAFRGNGTQAEWTNRQAFGHFFVRSNQAGRSPKAHGSGVCAFPAASAFPRFASLALRPLVRLLSVSHRALSRKPTKLRRGVGSPSGPRHAGGVEKATESRSVHFVLQVFSRSSAA